MKRVKTNKNTPSHCQETTQSIEQSMKIRDNPDAGIIREFKTTMSNMIKAQ